MRSARMPCYGSVTDSGIFFLHLDEEANARESIIRGIRGALLSAPIALGLTMLFGTCLFWLVEKTWRGT